MMAMYRWIPDVKSVKTWREAMFSGHFEPMGISAIFISTVASQFLFLVTLRRRLINNINSRGLDSDSPC